MWILTVQVSLIQNNIYALGQACMRSTLPLRNFPSATYFISTLALTSKHVLCFVWRVKLRNQNISAKQGIYCEMLLWFYILNLQVGSVKTDFVCIRYSWVAHNAIMDRIRYGPHTNKPGLRCSTLGCLCTHYWQVSRYSIFDDRRPHENVSGDPVDCEKSSS